MLAMVLVMLVEMAVLGRDGIGGRDAGGNGGCDGGGGIFVVWFVAFALLLLLPVAAFGRGGSKT